MRTAYVSDGRSTAILWVLTICHQQPGTRDGWCRANRCALPTLAAPLSVLAGACRCNPSKDDPRSDERCATDRGESAEPRRVRQGERVETATKQEKTGDKQPRAPREGLHRRPLRQQ